MLRTRGLLIAAAALALAIGPAVPATASGSDIAAAVVGALVGLGYNERVAAQAVDEAAGEAEGADASSVQSLLRLALARLGPQQVRA